MTLELDVEDEPSSLLEQRRWVGMEASRKGLVEAEGDAAIGGILSCGSRGRAAAGASVEGTPDMEAQCATFTAACVDR